jgi:methionine-rich copper-binding protein CopC
MNPLAKVALAATILLSSTYGALAHAHLKAQMPAADAKVSTSPATLSLTFSEGLEIGLSGATLKDANGKAVKTGTATLATNDDRRITVPLDGALAPGNYTVEWHVLSKDGHTTHGSYQFTVGP